MASPRRLPDGGDRDAQRAEPPISAPLHQPRCDHGGRLSGIERAEPGISRHKSLHGASDDELLEVVVIGRETRRGEPWDRATHAWRLLAARHHDRVRGLVIAFRFPGHPAVRIAPDEYDDAAQECFIRAVKMLGNFRGVSVDEFRGALRTCVTNTCMDFCRRRLTRERGLAGSIEDPRPGTEGDLQGRFDAAIAEIAVRKDEERTAARDELVALGAAIAQLENEQMREVLRKKMTGHTSREIATEIGVTIANVDQLCSRGLRKLREGMPHG